MAGLLTRSCCGRLPGSFFPVAKSRLLATNIWNLQQRDCSGFTPDSLLIAFLVCFEVCEPMRDKDREFIWLLQRGRSFSFVSRRKKKNQKERIKAAFFQLLRCFLRLKGRNSLRSNSLPFLTPEKTPALDAEKTRPGNHAAWACAVGHALRRGHVVCGRALRHVCAVWKLFIVRLSLAGILRWLGQEHPSEVPFYPCSIGRGWGWLSGRIVVVP